MKTIGGYFELELRKGEEYHKNAIRLNSGRNAFKYILQTYQYKKAYLPYYSCDALLEPLKELGIPYEFYHINVDMEPVFDLDRVETNACFLYINYFGLKTEFINWIAGYCNNLIIDNVQAFYAIPGDWMEQYEVCSFNSARKFFGVPDGAYLYMPRKMTQKLKVDKSCGGCQHLLFRADGMVEDGFTHYKNNEENLSACDMAGMSVLTQKILAGIDYESYALRRIINFKYLHKQLGKLNRLKLTIGVVDKPLSYPFWCNHPGVREYMIKKRIYTPQYWPEVLSRVDKKDIELDFTLNIFHIPVDHRYDVTDMQYIIDELLNYIQYNTPYNDNLSTSI